MDPSSYAMNPSTLVPTKTETFGFIVTCSLNEARRPSLNPVLCLHRPRYRPASIQAL